MKTLAKTILWVAIAGAVVVIFGVTAKNRLQYTETKSIEEIQQSQGVPVDIVVARRAPLEDWREFVGVAEGYEQVSLMVDFRTRIAAVNADVGDEVKKGETVVLLDPYDPARFMINLESARAAYENARKDSVRIEALFRSGAVSEQDLDRVRTACKAARVNWLTAKRAVELDAPFDGIVTSIDVQPGDYAPAQQVFATIASYDSIRVRLELSGTERSLVRKDQPARIELDGRPVLKGKVSKVSLSADPVTRLFSAEVVAPNAGHIVRPGMLVGVQILAGSSGEYPLIPEAALLGEGKAQHVFVVEAKADTLRANRRSVTTALRAGGLVAVSEGLQPGEKVVVWGQNKLIDGTLVRIHEDASPRYFGTR